MFKFGVSKREITPETSLVIPGYFEKRFVTGALDPLYVKAVVFEGETTAVSVVADTINLRRDDVLRIRCGISEKLGIPEGHISVSATHTHTGGPSWEWFEAGEHDPYYMTILIDSAIAAAEEAYETRVPAKIGFAAAQVEGYSFIRRFRMKNGTFRTNPGFNNPEIDHPLGTPDNTYIVGKVTDTNGKPLAFLSSYGVHLDMISGNKVSADYPGVLARLVEEKFGVESVFFTAPCGNTNHLNFRELPVDEPHPDLPAHERTGHALFRALCAIEGEISCTEEAVSVKREFLAARLRKPDPETVDTAYRFLSGEDLRFSHGMGHVSHHVTRHLAQATVAAHQNPVRMIDVELQLFDFGSFAMVFWPAEVFVEYGKAVREAFPDKKILIAELSNASFQCYLPTEEAIEQGGYEPTITGAVTPEPKIGSDLVRESIRLLGGAV
ncbi:MAG: hypothetical protein IJC88_05145 [Oscillospiraceae bacterium]|nr:hypothetical protein [Oscillospiraceae bacterium]